MAPLAKSQVIMRRAPMRRVGRRPQRSTKRRAGMVITTFMTYWIEEETSRLLPLFGKGRVSGDLRVDFQKCIDLCGGGEGRRTYVKPAIVKT